MMEKLLKVVNVSKKYEGHSAHAVINTSLEVNKGDLLVIIGESGCGKTTLLKLIAGLEELDSGKIFLKEKLITGPSSNLVPGHKEVKMVFQDFRLFPNITIYQNIEYALRAYIKSYQRERILNLLQLCRLEHIQHKYPREISGGEQQRAALARALADEPVLLLLDEPFSNLDGLLKQQLKNDITDIVTNSNTTALLVTHDTNDALSMADTIAVMKKGQIVQVDAPQTIYQKPASPYVANFFGSANIINLQWLLPYIENELGALGRIPVNRNTEVCIRAEQIHICSSGNCHFKGNIIRKNYMGAYYQITAVVDNRLYLLFHTTDASLQLGEEVPLQINLPSIHFFTLNSKV